MRSACLDEYQHAVVWYDDLFLFGRKGRVLVLAQGFLDLLLDLEQGDVQRGCLGSDFWKVRNIGAVQPSGDTNSSYLHFPTFFTGIFITLPHSSHFLLIYKKKATFR